MIETEAFELVSGSLHLYSQVRKPVVGKSDSDVYKDIRECPSLYMSNIGEVSGNEADKVGVQKATKSFLKLHRCFGLIRFIVVSG